MIEIKENIDIREMTTFGISAPCGRLVEFSDPPTDLPVLNKEGLLKDAIILGGGSNLLFTGRRNPKDLTVVHPSASEISIFGYEPDGSILFKVDAGVVLDDLCAQTCKEGYWGLENLSGIPGQIGGAAVQNVGAYGTEFKDVVKSVTCYDVEADRFVTLGNAECRYGYRDSIFKHADQNTRLIVCFVIIRLSRNYSPNLSYRGLRDALAPDETHISPMKVRNTVIAIREGKLPDPKIVGSAGSFFKNPIISPEELHTLQQRWANNPDSQGKPLPYHLTADGSAKLSAAWLIDKAGCKLLKKRGASLWPAQPLVIVNADGTATGEDILALEQRIIQQVATTFGVNLTPEVVHI